MNPRFSLFITYNKYFSFIVRSGKDIHWSKILFLLLAFHKLLLIINERGCFFKPYVGEISFFWYNIVYNLNEKE